MRYLFYTLSKLYKYRVNDKIFVTQKAKLIWFTQNKLEYHIANYFGYHIPSVWLSYT